MRNKLILASSVFALVASTSAIAQNTGFYGGIGLGQSRIKLDRGDFGAGAPVTATFDEKDTAWKIFAGYKFHPNFAAELSYNDFGKADARYEVPAAAFGAGRPAAAGSARADYKATSWALWGVGMAPVAQQFSIFGKLGVARNEAERSALSPSFADPAGDMTAPAGKKTKTGVAWGIGAQYDFNQRVGLRLEYEDFGKFGNSFNNANDSGRAKVNMWSLSIVGRF